jgi:DNA-binding NtrC family response regulator
MDQFRVLIVDDEKLFLETLVQRLNLRSIQAHGVENGEEALKFLDGFKTDVVVLDLRMPGMGGMKALAEIKRRFPLVEVIVLTGHGAPELGEQGIRLGAFDHLIKPVKIDTLIERIRAAHDRRLRMMRSSCDLAGR